MSQLPLRFTCSPFPANPGGSAVFSECREFRQQLERWWQRRGRHALVCMANPSDADHQRNDPTIWRLIDLLKGLDHHQFTVVNDETYIASSPLDLRRWRAAAIENNPDGYQRMRRHNLERIRRISRYVDTRIIAWGNLVEPGPAAEEVITAMSLDGRHPLYAFGLTQGGAPKHPMARGKHRIVSGTPLVEWRSANPPTVETPA